MKLLSLGCLLESVPQILRQGNFDHTVKANEFTQAFSKWAVEQAVSPVSKE